MPIPTQSGYLKLREAFFIEDETFPSGIALPMTAAETQRLVRHCIRANVPFTVRGGGHDPFTRYAAQDAVTIDLRHVSYVHVGADKTTATIGGGTTHGTLVAELQTHGLHAATGSVATVGYVGWAAIGGYGPSSAWAGLGVDQIVAARIVDAEGELVDAAEKALRGIRGGRRELRRCHRHNHQGLPAGRGSPPVHACVVVKGSAKLTAARPRPATYSTTRRT